MRGFMMAGGLIVVIVGALLGIVYLIDNSSLGHAVKMSRYQRHQASVLCAEKGAPEVLERGGRWYCYIPATGMMWPATPIVSE